MNETSFAPLLTVEQVAAALNIRRGRAYDLIARKVLPAVHLGRQKRVTREALLRFIESGGVVELPEAPPTPRGIGGRPRRRLP